MSLKREDYPDLTDEAWDTLVAEFDRARTQASKTARENAEKAAQKEVEAAIERAREEGREEARVLLEADEQGKLEIERKKLAEREAALAADRRSLEATKKLVSAGYSEEQVEGLLPIFTGLDDKVFAPSLDNFIKVNETTIKTKLDAERQALLNNATPPTSPTGGPVDATSAAVQAANDGNAVEAVDILLTEAGYTATPTA